MTAAWMLWTVVVSALVALAARALEEASHLLRLPLRWVWAGALAGSAAAPLLAHLFLRAGTAGGAATTELEVVTALLGVPDAPAGAASFPFDWTAALVPYDGLLLAGWVAASVAVLLLVALVAVVFAWRRRDWREAEVDGHTVLLTRDVGPAVAGLLRGRIVLPEWALRMAPPLRSLMLEHEAEHVRAGDPRLLGAGLVLAALFPWNPVAWWQLRRLRLAIEVDCDARVLCRWPDPRAYGDLLLEMGARGQRHPLLAAAFSEPRTTLETRIRRMTETTPRARRVRIGVFLALAIGGIALACEAPAPDAPLALEPQATRAAEEAASTEVDRTPPALLDDAAVHEAIRAGYPPLLRDAGIEGTAEVQLYVNASGQVERMQLNATSGYEALDAAALKVAGQLRFRPATEGGSAVAAWTKVPIGFELEGAAAAAKAGVEEDVKTVEEAIAQLTGEPARPERGVFERERTADGPQFTPFNQAPALRNRNEVQRLLQHEYPPLLRDAGIGGGADVWLYIEADGTLTKSQLNRTSGYPALDEAALRVAQQMQFEPARKGDQPVPVWISLKIEFAAK